MYVHIQYTNFLSSLQVCTLCPVYIYERVCQCRCTCKQKKDEDSCTMNNNKYVYTHVCACSILYSCICFYYSMCMFVLYCTYMYVHVSVYVIVHVRVCLCGGVYGCMRVMCVCMCTYINACTYVCMYTCAYNQSPWHGRYDKVFIKDTNMYVCFLSSQNQWQTEWSRYLSTVWFLDSSLQSCQLWNQSINLFLCCLQWDHWQQVGGLIGQFIQIQLPTYFIFVVWCILSVQLPWWHRLLDYHIDNVYLVTTAIVHCPSLYQRNCTLSVWLPQCLHIIYLITHWPHAVIVVYFYCM